MGNAAEDLVRRKVGDARGEPDQDQGISSLFFFTEPEEISPLDRQTLDEDRTQKFWEPTRRDE